MKYLSVCSGLEAITNAWELLGFKPIGFAEIEPFPCELLKQKYPQVKNYGDITQYENGEKIKRIGGKIMYKDKDKFEYEDFNDIEYYNEDSVICPCCGDVKDIDDIASVANKGVLEIECMECGCIFEATAEISFSTVCKKYRTDKKEK